MIFGIDHAENEIAILEIINFINEQLETYMTKISEFNFLLELDKYFFLHLSYPLRLDYFN